MVLKKLLSGTWQMMESKNTKQVYFEDKLYASVVDINNIPDGFEIFKDIMLKYMVKNIEIYRKVISNNEELNNKVLTCFGMQLVYDLRKLEENLTILYSSYSDIYN